MLTVSQRLDALEKAIRHLDHQFQHSAHIMSALHDLSVIVNRMEQRQMADAESVLAKITGMTDALKALDAAANALEEGQANIQTRIDDLKAQIAAGGTPTDFGPIDAALDEQNTVIAGIADSVSANTTLAKK